MNESRISRVFAAKPSTVDSMLVTKPSNVKYLLSLDHEVQGALLITATDCYFITGEEPGIPMPANLCLVVVENRHSVLAVKELVATQGIESLGVELETLTYDISVELRQELPCSLSDVSGVTENLRMTKDTAEIESIKSAVAIAERSFEETLGIIRPGITEVEIAIALETYMLRNGSTGIPFTTIVVSGPRTSMPHGLPTSRQVNTHELITIDYGATFRGYCCDITRTFALGSPSEEALSVYKTVQRAQKAAISVIREGTIAKKVDEAARQLITAEGYGPFFGHGCGHGVGVEVHERPALRHYPGPLPRNAVLAVEPGVYLPGAFGVRIEDMVIVTTLGVKQITSPSSELLVL